MMIRLSFMLTLLLGSVLLAVAQIGPIPGFNISPPKTCVPHQINGNSLTNDSASWSGYTTRFVIPAANITALRSCVDWFNQVVQTGNGSNGVVIGNSYVCNQGGAQPYSCAAAPVQITWSGGSSGVTIGVNSSLASDYVRFTWNGSSNLVVTNYFSGTSNIAYSSGGSYVFYYKSASDASNQNPSGYSTAGSNIQAVNSISVR